jgi:hypothetical protein
MITMIKDTIDENNILVRMFYNNMSKSYPITVQALDDDCGEIIETTKCPDMIIANKVYNRYLYGQPNETLSINIL